MVSDFANRGALLLGATLASRRRVAGGDLSDVLRIELTDGRTAIVKTGPDPGAEAAMLDAIRATHAVAPRVLAVDERVLVLEDLPNDGRVEDAFEDLGVNLSRLHQQRAVSRNSVPVYGWHCDYAFGKVVIENAADQDWPTFWGERRLANQASYLPRELGLRLERLAKVVAELIPSRPPRALLHGDLWSGNILATGNRVSGLIDPACYFGDREVDYSMLALFGRVDRHIFERCEPLSPGFEQRRPVYQLWPALVHFRLFGNTYRPLVERLLGKVGV